MVTFSEAGAAIFIKAINNNILQLSRGMPKLNSVWLVGDCLYSPIAEKGSSWILGLRQTVFLETTYAVSGSPAFSNAPSWVSIPMMMVSSVSSRLYGSSGVPKL